MIELFKFWLSENTSLTENSKNKYCSAINNISKDMQDQGILRKSLYNTDKLELDKLKDKILSNTFFIEKNSRGNNMYSSALGYYDQFLKEWVYEFVSNDNCFINTESFAKVKIRVGQGNYRRGLINKYGGRCLVTGLRTEELLIASHIKPWADCLNNERLDVENGFLLSPTIDKLFDNGYITFQDNGSLIISDCLLEEDRRVIGIYEGLVVDLKSSYNMLEYLQYHRSNIFKE